MTAVVKRGAGRPAAAAKSTRHAQRTPLPPKGETPETTAPEKTTRSRRKAVTGSEESPNPVRRTATKSSTAKAAEEAAPDVAKPSGGTRKAPAKTTAKRTRTATATTLPEDFPGRSKIMRLLDGPAQAAGWDGSVKIVDLKTGAVEVAISKGAETMTWYAVGGKQDPSQAPSYSDGNRTVLMKNIAAILAQATGERQWIKPAGATRTKRAPRTSPVKDVPQRQPLPFDPAEATEAEVVSALRGKTLTWQNGISKAIDSAVVAVRAKIKVEQHPTTGERVVTFSDPVNTGTRSVRLSGILTIKG
jgi:hypothetical protein